MFIPSLLTLWVTLQSPLNSPLAKGQLGIACGIGFVTRCALCEKVSGAGGDWRTFGFLSRGTVTSMVLNNSRNGGSERVSSRTVQQPRSERSPEELLRRPSLPRIGLGVGADGFKHKQSQKTSNVGRTQQSFKRRSLIRHCDVEGFCI